MTSKKPLVSVIIVCHNHELFIKEAIESVINQTYKNIELMVIDNGSTDNSKKEIEKYNNSYIQTVFQDNIGLVNTLNKYIPTTKGKYFSYLSSDDYWSNKRIEMLVDYLEKHPEYALCYSPFYEVTMTDNKKIIKKISNKNYKGGYIFDNLLLNDFSIWPVATLIRKDVFSKVGYYDPNIELEDWDMWLKIARNFEIGYLNTYQSFWRLHKHNLHKNVNFMIENIKKTLRKWQDAEIYNECIKRWNLNFFNYMAQKHKLLALKYLFLSLGSINKIKFYKSIYKLLFRW